MMFETRSVFPRAIGRRGAGSDTGNGIHHRQAAHHFAKNGVVLIELGCTANGLVYRPMSFR